LLTPAQTCPFQPSSSGVAETRPSAAEPRMPRPRSKAAGPPIAAWPARAIVAGNGSLGGKWWPARSAGSPCPCNVCRYGCPLTPEVPMAVLDGYETIQVEIDDDKVATITLNRPE